MFRYKDGQFKVAPPAKVVDDGFVRNFFDLTREEWDELGYNEAMPIKREPFTTYETQWVKGEDMIYREEIVKQEVDEAAMVEAESAKVRSERDRLLTSCDWTQLADSALDMEGLSLWQDYRQSLRDIPQQPDFPTTVEWPDVP